jgi:hypothetical protein
VTQEKHVCEVRPAKINVGFDLDVRCSAVRWAVSYAEPNAIGCAKFDSRSNDAVIHVYDAVGNVIDLVGLFTGRSQSNIRRISGVSHLFAFSHHRHDPFFDGGYRRRAQAKRE